MDNLSNDLAFWFPILAKTGVAVPRTEIIKTDCDLLAVCMGEIPDGFVSLCNEVDHAAERIGGYPCFLRSGQTSAKHEWEDTCFLRQWQDIAEHIASIVEYGEMASLLGLPTDTWVVRELLPTMPIGEAFRGMPVTKERRYFIGGGKVICHHPYWPKGALENYPAITDGALALLNHESEQEVSLLTELSAHVSKAFPGEWSLDWLFTKRGWFAIDMALMSESYHWPGCPNNPHRDSDE